MKKSKLGMVLLSILLVVGIVGAIGTVAAYQRPGMDTIKQYRKMIDDDTKVIINGEDVTGNHFSDTTDLSGYGYFIGESHPTCVANMFAKYYKSYVENGLAVEMYYGSDGMWVSITVPTSAGV